MPVEARAYFRTHYLPVLSHGLQVYLNLLNSAHQPVGAREIQLFAKNVVEQVQADYTRPAHWPTIVRFMRKTNRPDVNKALQTHRTDLWGQSFTRRTTRRRNNNEKIRYKKSWSIKTNEIRIRIYLARWQL